jgi:hypothetical protein
MADIRMTFTNIKMARYKTVSQYGLLFMVTRRLQHTYVDLGFPKFVNIESGRMKEQEQVI